MNHQSQLQFTLDPMQILQEQNTCFEYLQQISITDPNLLNPVNILDKGYSIVYKDNKIVKDVTKLKLDDSINIMAKNGNIIANVKGVEKK